MSVSARFLSFSLFVLFSNQVLASSEEVQEWLPPALKSRSAEVSAMTAAETAEKIKCDDSSQDFGFSIPGHNRLQADCLSEIAKRYKAADYKREAVQVLDVAAGLGNMSWKMALAGGFVSAIELQSKAAATMNLKVFRTLKQFFPAEDAKTAYRPSFGNAFAFGGPVYDRAYPIVWIGHFLHFLPPKMVEPFFTQMFKCTAEDGLVFATFNAPGMNQAIINLYNSRLSAGDPHPGYIVLNKSIFRSRQLNQNTKVSIHGAVTPNSDDPLNPGVEMDGFYGDKLEKAEWAQTSDSDVMVRKAHSIMHLIGPADAKKHFERAGFVVEDLFYLSRPKGGRIELNAMSDQALAQDSQVLAIKARKPKPSCQKS
jgi:hypothetical protein